MRTRHAALLALSIASSALMVPTTVLGHPLGNFTINHYSELRSSPVGVHVDHVLDMAEIPTFSERAGMDTDLDGTVSDAEASSWAAAACGKAGADFDLRADGERLRLRPGSSRVSFPMGQGALTLRLECSLRTDLGAALSERPTNFTFEDATYPVRRGWREIVVIADGVRLLDSSVLGTSASARLTSYPSDLFAAPMNDVRADWSAVIGDGSPANAGAQDTMTFATSPRPGGEIGPDLAGLFQTRDLTLPLAALLVAAAALLGALHALSPGHGKTVMAAYLVGSRGTLRKAAGLALAVTVSHTVGVLVLGGLSLAASNLIPVERLYPILGTVSGTLVIAVGAWLLLARIRAVRAGRAAHGEHRQAHERGIAHLHEHGGHEHGAHEHGLGRHGHAHQADAPGWRGLVALGLAGGMVPSVSALILLLGSVALGRPAFGIVLTVAFGLGMAGVLVGIGALLVVARSRLERLSARNVAFGLPGRLVALVPTTSAMVVLLLGVALTGQAIAGWG